MSQNRDSYVRRSPLSAERYAAAANLPLAPRACVRLARAIENGRKQPQLADISEEIAATKALDAQSLLTGWPRWRELQDQIEGWIAESV